MSLIELVRIVVVAAAVSHGLLPDSLVALMTCESSLSPYAVNGQYWGLAQLGPVHRARFAARGYDNVFDPSQAANYTAEVIVAEGASAWTCGRGLDWTVTVP